ncbi:MAG TPA: MlaD family protein [Roseateles sp.]
MKKRRASPLAIGGFVVGGLAILVAALILLPGHHWFDRPQRVVMFFSGSVFGLQKGAPVVFRGVRVGDVTDISVRYDSKTDSFAIPVIAELDDSAVRGLEGRFTHDDIGHALPVLIKRGLTAQLGTQSLLTGQLYVDLDFRSKPPGVLHGGYEGDATEIPTSATAFQALKNQLESVDLRKVLDDLSQIANSVRTLVAAPELKQGLKDFAATAGHARALAAQLEQRAAPLTRSAERAMASVDRAGDKVSGAADKLGQGADNAKVLLDPNGPVARDLQRALDELARASGSLREAADSDGPLMQRTERTMRDLSQAARALRQLANTLDAQPEALLRGRKPDVNPPAPAGEPAR